MVHRSAGTFDVPLPGIEGRQSGGTYTLVFTFANNLTSVGGASVTGGRGDVRIGTIGPRPNQYTVNLTGVPNQQYLAVTLRAVQDTTGNKGSVVGPAMGVLVGDVSADGLVTKADLSLVQAQAGKQVNSSNFRDDVNVDGFMNGGDADAVRSQLGRGLPTSTPVTTSTSTFKRTPITSALSK
jgi:hypothetical protein